MTREQEVTMGMWRTIKALHAALASTAPTVGWLYDRLPQEHRLEGTRRLDIHKQTVKLCDELVAPMRKIMEGGK